MTDDNCEFDELETEAYKRLSEIRTLKHRVKRYWTRLTKEALKVAKHQGLEMRIAQGPTVYDPSEVIVFYNCGNLRDDNLLKLAKPSYPSLYRRYKEGLERYAELRHILEELDAKLENDSMQH